MQNNETIIWEDKSSQILNFLAHTLSLIVMIGLGIGGKFYPIVWLAIPIVLAFTLWNFLVVRFQSYKLTNERIIIKKGVFNRITDELELYRVKDHRLEQPFFLRIFGLGNIIIITSDQLNREVLISAVYNSEEVRENIRKLVEARRFSLGVRELDTN
jgi:uncharacterized membrane protein YdbT with pleckstrin-like domain